MKTIKFLFLFLFLSCSVTFADTIKTNTTNAPIQLSLTSLQVIAVLPQGTELETNEVNDKFYVVEYEGIKGYLYKNYATNTSVGNSTLNNFSKDPVISTSIPNAKLGKEPAAGIMTKDFLYVDGKTAMGYWIYTPEDISQPLPLIVYLHAGAGGAKSDKALDDMLGSNQLMENLYGKKTTPNAIVIMPLSPEINGFRASQDGPSIQYLRCLINKIVEVYNIDISRISITGVSTGSLGASLVASSSPKTFSALAMIAGVGSSKSMAENLKNIAVRGYWGTQDTNTGTCSRALINEIKGLGGNAEYIEFQGVNHGGTCRKVFAETDVIEWLITQVNKQI